VTCPGPPKLIFLISLPRSGSTLLQKILAAHPEIASAGEPWILLPLAFLDRSKGMEAIYDHGNASRGIQEMIARLSQGRRTYMAHLRQFCLGIFQDLSHNKPIFLEKDPRYYLILDFLAELFPEAKFIFLFRNPLDVMCSMMNTWLGGRLKLHAYHIDLYEGVRAISRGASVYADKSIKVHYARLIEDPAREVRGICDFLKISYFDEMLLKYKNIDFGGSMGDPTGIKKYDGVSEDSACVWPHEMNNFYRVRFARKYLAVLGDEVLIPWQFSRREFETTVSQTRIRWRGSLQDMAYRNLSDLWRMLNGSRMRRIFCEPKTREIYLFR
jgi:hypothetical protein